MKCLYCGIEWLNLEKFIQHAEKCMMDKFKKLDYMTFRSIQSRNLPYYGKYKKEYSYHFNAFCGMHKRNAVDDAFSRNFGGFMRLIEYLGPVPIGIKMPSVGRINHKIGYIKGNFAWQELLDNLSDVGKRTGFKNISVKFTTSYKKRQALIDFLSDNVGKFHIIDICNIVGYKDCRRVLDFIKNRNDCQIENFRNRRDCFIRVA